MVREFISPAPDRLCQRHGRTATGDGFAWRNRWEPPPTQEMGNFYGHLHAREAMTNPKLWPRPQADDLAAAGIVIDAERQAHRRRELWRYLSLERHRAPARSTQHDCNFRSGDLGRPARPRPCAAAQSAAAGEWRHVHRPIRSRNSHRKSASPRNNSKTSSRPITRPSKPRHAGQTLAAARRHRAKVWPIKTAPFYAIPLCTAITNTMGGIAIDGDCRVLDTGGKPIPGLYAAGSTIGGLDGGRIPVMSAV